MGDLPLADVVSAHAEHFEGAEHKHTTSEMRSEAPTVPDKTGSEISSQPQLHAKALLDRPVVPLVPLKTHSYVQVDLKDTAGVYKCGDAGARRADDGRHQRPAEPSRRCRRRAVAELHDRGMRQVDLLVVGLDECWQGSATPARLDACAAAVTRGLSSALVTVHAALPLMTDCARPNHASDPAPLGRRARAPALRGVVRPPVVPADPSGETQGPQMSYAILARAVRRTRA